VINLSVDKPAVFAEVFRVLKAGGRMGVSDVVADDSLTPEQRAERGDHVGCIAGALSFAAYRQGLEAAGFTDVEITPTHPVADGMHSAVVRAVKPAGVTEVNGSSAAAACCGASGCCTADEHAADPSTTVAEAKAASGCGCQG
jgi:arsenite methyltransferase